MENVMCLEFIKQKLYIIGHTMSSVFCVRF